VVVKVVVGPEGFISTALGTPTIARSVADAALALGTGVVDRWSGALDAV
jgi:hypothetical protein